MEEITTDKLDEILNFIGRERAILMSKINHLGQDEFIVLIPEWLLNVLRHYISCMIHQPVTPNCIYIHGCKVQYHYKDEVVVFYKGYHVNRGLLSTPAIYILNQ